MLIEKRTILLWIMFFFVAPNLILAQRYNEPNKDEIYEQIQMLRKYFGEEKSWHVTDPEIENKVSGLLNFLEAEPIDQILTNLTDSQKVVNVYVDRLPSKVGDSLSVPGYISGKKVQSEVEKIRKTYLKNVNKKNIVVPNDVIQQAKKEVELIPKGKGLQLFSNSVYSFPDSLIIPEVIPDSVLNSQEEFNRLVHIDNLRKEYVEKKRIAYNDSITRVAVNKTVQEYRDKKYQEGLAYKINRYKETVKRNNYHVLNNYNNEVVAQVNDSIHFILGHLLAYADYIDTTRVSIGNISGEKESILLQNGNQYYSRVWLKNRQQDSLRVVMKNLDKNSIEMLIDDGVTFSRFKEKEAKKFDFSSLRPTYKFNNVDERYKVYTPWAIEAEGSLGITQTYYDNWSSGGTNSITFLFGIDASADYTSTDKKIKWENDLDIDNGWIKLKPGKHDSVWQKSTDDVELTSQFGISATNNKKWYYSAELSLTTQLFKGYTYPRSTYPTPKSAFFAPVTTYLKFGMEYTPKDDVSLLVSPLTIKNVFVRDTALVDQTNYSIDENRKAYWKPGLNLEFSYTKEFTPKISYETSYTMFINYKDPMQKYDIDWKNTIKASLGDHINMKFYVYLLYDDDVLFSVYDDDGNEIGERAKWQIKEYLSFNLSYTFFTRDVKRAKRIH